MGVGFSACGSVGISVSGSYWQCKWQLVSVCQLVSVSVPGGVIVSQRQCKYQLMAISGSVSVSQQQCQVQCVLGKKKGFIFSVSVSVSVRVGVVKQDKIPPPKNTTTTGTQNK